jgi:hypothetical protein
MKRKMDKWANAKGRTLEGEQVKCLTSSEGHVWIAAYDYMSPRVRARLAYSPFNICPTCLRIEVGANATDADYFRCIQVIEGKLRSSD